MAEREYIELAQLQALIKEGLEEAFPGKVWVKAEISSWSPRANGHCYLSLSQSEKGKLVAEIRAMIWKWNYPRVKTYFEEATGETLKAGITVLVRAQISYSEIYGISLFVDDIDPSFTLGEKALEKKRIIERLTSGGYMEMQKELALPELPRRLAVITSKTAAGYGDFRRHLLENDEGYAFVLDLYEALMQGEQAPESIMAAIERVQAGEYDALLILRGGGSELDLACFDDEDLAMAIAECPIPVITAIGHDRDFHIADMVAMQYVKTPTALADLFLEAFSAQDDIISNIGSRISIAMQKRIGDAQRSLESRSGNIRSALQRRVGDAGRALESRSGNIRSALQRRVGDAQRSLESRFGRVRSVLHRRLGELEGPLQKSISRVSRALTLKLSESARSADASAHRIKFAAGARISSEVSRVALKEALIKASDPRNILSLGYVLVTGKDNKVLKTVDRVHTGDRIGVRFSDGSLTAKVDQVFSETKDQNKTNIA